MQQRFNVKVFLLILGILILPSMQARRYSGGRGSSCNRPCRQSCRSGRGYYALYPAYYPYYGPAYWNPYLVEGPFPYWAGGPGFSFGFSIGR
jgi:hypothetical protein